SSSGSKDHSKEVLLSKMIELHPDLRKLTCVGDIDCRIHFREHLTDFTSLTFLQLANWRVSDGTLSRALEAVSSTLTNLKLHRIEGLESNDFENLCLPLVTTLDICLDTMPDRGLGKLLQHCPVLSELVVYLDLKVYTNAQQRSHLAGWIRKSSPISLTRFKFGDRFHEAYEILHMIQTIRTLTSLKCSGPIDVAIAESIVKYHGHTFKEFCMDSIGDRIEPKALAILLESCPLLERLYILSAPLFDAELMREILQRPWACHWLKELNLSRVLATLPREDENIEPPSTAFLLPRTSRYAGFGWYEHEQRTRNLNIVARLQRRMGFLVRLFEQVQGMYRLNIIYMNGAEYIRSSIPREHLRDI
ncbi:hypothetical protein BGX27_009287, partial [Mortierella sp. AM989]